MATWAPPPDPPPRPHSTAHRVHYTIPHQPLWNTPPPRVTFRRVAVPLRGPGQSPVRPFACCVGSLRSVGRCGRCSRWCRFCVRGAPSLVCWGCAGCGGMCCWCVRGVQSLAYWGLRWRLRGSSSGVRCPLPLRALGSSATCLGAFACP